MRYRLHTQRVWRPASSPSAPRRGGRGSGRVGALWEAALGLSWFRVLATVRDLDLPIGNKGLDLGY